MSDSPAPGLALNKSGVLVDGATGQFVKGHSGNTKGISKEAAITRALAMRSTPEALATLLAIMRSKKASLKVRKECAIEILDRGGVPVIKALTKDEENEKVTAEWDDAAIDAILGDDEDPGDEE